MKKIIVFLALVTIVLGCTKNGPYDESADARADVQQALIEAKAVQLPLIIIFGANWCPDCRALSEELSVGKDAINIINDFKVVKVNVGNFDANLDVAKNYGNPISGGIPGAALLSSDGNIVYVTKPGELTSVREKKAEGLYQFFKKHLV